MAEKVGRLGYLGIAIESTPGTPQGSPSVFIPFIENTILGHQEPIGNFSAKANRVKEFGSVVGKKWGEGNIKMYLDSTNAAYLLKMAFGSESLTQKNATPPTYDHLMYPTVSGNIPTTATLWDYKGVDVQQYAYASVDSWDLDIKNSGIAELSASIKSKAATTVTAPTLTTTSGYLFTWKDMSAGFGATIQAAAAATPTKLTEFKMTGKNNLELAYKSGSNSPDTLVMQDMEVSGEYSLYFENSTDRDNYLNNNKQSMVVTLTGADLGSGFNEQIIINIRKMRTQTFNMDTGIDKLFLIKCTFNAEWSQDQAGFVDVTVRNGKSSAY